MKIHKEAARFGLFLTPVGIACAIYLSLTNIQMALNMGIEPSKPLIFITSIVQIALIYTLLLSYLGYQLAQKVGLMKPLGLNSNTFKPILLLSLFSALVMLSDYFLFAPYIPQVLSRYERETFTLSALIFSMLYGGVIEEIMLRLFFLSLMVVFLDLLFKRTKQGLPIPSFYYCICNAVSALFFALGHLPATQAAFGELSFLIILRTLVLNGALGYLFGWIFITFGIQWAMLTHALTHLFSQAFLLLFIL